jgi:hypothetical protein
MKMWRKLISCLIFCCANTHWRKSGSNSPWLLITPDDVQLVMKYLPLGKDTATDDINNRILRELSHELSGPLSSLFNYFIQVSQVRDVWRKTNGSPLFKSGDHSLVYNYRPVSSISTVNKVLKEMYLNKKLNFCVIIILLHLFNPVLFPETPLSTNLHIYIICLQRPFILVMKSGLCFVT